MEILEIGSVLDFEGVLLCREALREGEVFGSALCLKPSKLLLIVRLQLQLL